MKSFNKLVKTLAISTLGLGIATASISEAKAASLVPQTEGEIKLTNLDCLDPNNCIDTTTLPLGYTVTSLDYDFDGKGPQFGISRLFADDRTTTNPELNAFGITFKAEDEGTNPLIGQTWFRPVANVLDSNGNLVPFENGRLEVGRFKFDLGKTVGEVRLDFFDTEDENFTGVIEVNGIELAGQDLLDMLLPAGPDSNIQTLVLKDVKDFVVQLGKPGPDSVFRRTGDGVALTVSVPESGTTLGLSVLAVAGLLILKSRKKASQKA
ncbi:MAG: LEVG family PEP-CTERM protein [Nostocales cyanobacterium 94392]|nr:LEVG family PEP-CTERM protein [Nostocales cyanobacterium 94392]